LLRYVCAICAICGAPALAQPTHDTATGGEAESFRDSILRYYGFSQAASDAIRAAVVRLEIEDWESQAGGVSWDPSAKTLKLKGTQQQAAVQAFARVWWDVKQSSAAETGRTLAAEVAKSAVLKKEFGTLNGGDLFAALAGWTMGRYKAGAHALPKRLRKQFDPMFTGKIYRTPWYDGGVP